MDGLRQFVYTRSTEDTDQNGQFVEEGTESRLKIVVALLSQR